ncbi:MULTISPECIES: hypothetical protein [Halorussus]|uniref:hypothetical protein n=1 Tax=Halorussus TaxID=1070314 RepID=UPI00209D299F|nr:hypothetical protein [Halorussus vallis]USZ74937.1 hypothetical protein NGM07_16040 [Halorussus vallis]
MDETDVVFVYEDRDDGRPVDIYNHFEDLPDSFETGREEPVSNFEIVEKDGVGGMLFSYDEPVFVGFIVPNSPYVQLDVRERQFDVEDEAKLAVRVRNLLDVIREVYVATADRPRFVYAFPDPLVEVILDFGTLPATVETLRDGRINYVGWITVFPPELVETYGRDTLLSAPGWSVEE